MKKIAKVLALFAAMAVLALVGCKVTVSEEDEKPGDDAVSSVTLNTNALTLSPDGTGTLTATVTPSNADDKKVTWSSDKTEVATVDQNGTVTAGKEGTATITAQAGGKTATCTVTVKQISVAVKSITLDITTLTLNRGETKKLTATVKPDNADDKTVSWSSSDENVATVDNDGKVTAVGKGEATVTATAQAGGKTATCKVTVSEKDEKPGAVAVVSVTLDKNTLTLIPGGTWKLTATVKPDNADNKTVTWSSDKTEVATVDQNGNVTAGKAGSAKITAEAGGKTAECNVTVSDGYEIENGVLTKYNGSATEVVIPDGVTSIDKEAFEGKKDITSVTIPSSVTSIGKYTFSECDSLNTVTYCGTLAQWCAMDSRINNAKSVVLADEGDLDLKAAPTLTIPDRVTSIGRGAFYSCTSLTSVTIPESVTSIGEEAFSGCKNLTSVIIPGSVNTIEQGAFYGCTSLTSVTILGSVKTIELGAFYGCNKLKSVTIPTSVTSIKLNAFYDCTSLNTVTYDGTKTDWERIDINSKSGLNGKTITGKDEDGDKATWKCK